MYGVSRLNQLGTFYRLPSPLQRLGPQCVFEHARQQLYKQRKGPDPVGKDTLMVLRNVSEALQGALRVRRHAVTVTVSQSISDSDRQINSPSVGKYETFDDIVDAESLHVALEWNVQCLSWRVSAQGLARTRR